MVVAASPRPFRHAAGWRGTVRIASAALAIWAAIVLALAPNEPALAQSGARALTLPEIEQAWPRLPVGERLSTIEQLIRQRHLDAAERLLARVEAREPIDRDRVEFYRGALLKARGRHAEAVVIYRSLLAANPGFDRVRLELAHTLFLMGEDDGAKHHFDLLLGASAAQPQVAEAARSFINTIDGRRRWSFSAHASLAPSTNLNQGSETRIVIVNGVPLTIAERNRAKSGIGVVAGLQGGYAFALADGVDLVTSAGGSMKRYQEDYFNDTLATLSLGPRWRSKSSMLGIYGLVEQRWLADHYYSGSYGAMLSASTRVFGRDTIGGDLVCQRRHYDRDWLGANLGYQDGHACSLALRYERPIDTSTVLRLLGGAGLERTGLSHLDNEHVQAGLGLYREFPLAMTVYAQGLYRHARYRADYPGFAEARIDHRMDLSLALTKRDLAVMGFAPTLQYTYTLNASTIPLHDFDAHGVNLTFTKRF